MNIPKDLLREAVELSGASSQTVAAVDAASAGNLC
jgi:hypothetical protein